MAIRIFDVEDKQVVINEHCLLIPELKAVYEEYENPIPVFSYLYFMTDPTSPYGNIEEDAREEIIMEDYPGDYTSEDIYVRMAMDKLKKLYETPTRRLFMAAKRNLETLAHYLSTTEMKDGKDGNLGEIYRIQTGLAKLVLGFKDLERLKDDEEGTARGNTELGYDEI